MMNTTLKMWTYVAYQLIGGFEHEASKSEGLSGATGKVGYSETSLIRHSMGPENNVGLGGCWIMECLLPYLCMVLYLI